MDIDIEAIRQRQIAEYRTTYSRHTFTDASEPLSIKQDTGDMSALSAWCFCRKTILACMFNARGADLSRREGQKTVRFKKSIMDEWLSQPDSQDAVLEQRFLYRLVRWPGVEQDPLSNIQEFTRIHLALCDAIEERLKNLRGTVWDSMHNRRKVLLPTFRAVVLLLEVTSGYTLPNAILLLTGDNDRMASGIVSLGNLASGGDPRVARTDLSTAVKFLCDLQSRENACNEGMRATNANCKRWLLGSAR